MLRGVRALNLNHTADGVTARQWDSEGVHSKKVMPATKGVKTRGVSYNL